MYKNLIFILFLYISACQTVNLNDQVVSAFQTYKELNVEFLASVRSNGREMEAARGKVENYMYNEYTEALRVLEKRYCLEPNEKLVNEFFSVLYSTKNSAYELPAFVLGKMYICRSDIILKAIDELDKNKKKYIVNTLEWGFKNAAYEKKINNYKELENAIDKIKGKLK